MPGSRLESNRRRPAEAMIALDTNVLVRLLLRDDETRARETRRGQAGARTAS